MKLRTKYILLPIQLAFSSFAHASFPAVQNLHINGDHLHWDEVADAGGYNVYFYAGGPSKFEITFDYLATVKNTTTYSGLQTGIYKVVAFNSDATAFGDLDSARSIWLKPDGTVDNFNLVGSTVMPIGESGQRYIVENRCVDESTGICVASCNTGGNQGVVTGGYCSASESRVNASGGENSYSCYSPDIASEIVAGAYCLRE